MECSVRVGKVSSVNTQKHAVRVAFSDVSAVSSEIPVLRFANGWAKDNSLPSVGDSVVCVFMGSGVGSGYCLGSFYRSGDSVPGNSDQFGVYFDDGSSFLYDRSKKSFVIVGDLEVSGEIKQGDSS
ncbi:phage baseplate assembly protein V [Paenibacillus larvae]|uniref:Baseplate assembly protein n=1 Tax=Bacteriophage Lily TaxID=1589751 RepID=A0A0C5AEP6_9CAUD|nr:phage baseplate assembly protein V [Paenibacillus larvae]YP_009202226.1 baseplate assembly protein V [Bacteriophage Lily]AJK27744.1 baseplate assembly protein [Bacteriophage Lily]MCY9564619.1 phage baseplate assembly protein V [Paenibacillus larvae]MCY9568349.1 phage baseplate assembly protein V [Paenibacillus larvae]MCY9571689.1 phage baseplate assembly protein V [Paenibacillus larvae]MDT2171679.1 phage baseplate assembly protein V [Paenibacillus larvae]